VHVIASQGHDAVRLGQWIKALKAVVGGLRRRESGVGPAVGTGERIEEHQEKEADIGVVGRVPSPGAKADIGADAGSGDPAYKDTDIGVVGRVPSPGAKADIGADAGSGDPAYKDTDIGVVGRVPSPGAKTNTGADAGSGDPAYKDTDIGVVGRVPSPGAKADIGADAGSGDPAYKDTDIGVVGRVPSPGEHEFMRLRRSWRWQEGFHDHKFRTPESEQRKWEYVCLNPVRYGLVERPEQWPFGGEVFYDHPSGPRLVRGTPPLLETGILVNEDGSVTSPGEGTRPTGEGL